MPFYVSTWLPDGSQPTAASLATGAEWLDLGPWQSAQRTEQDYALAWTPVQVSAPGVFVIADAPGSTLNNPTVRNINDTLGTDLPRVTLTETVWRLMTVEACAHVWRGCVYDGGTTFTIQLGPLDVTREDTEVPYVVYDPPIVTDRPPEYV